MVPELGIVLDAGTGLFRVGEYLMTPALDIFLTHWHADHVWGLDMLWIALINQQFREYAGLIDDENAKTLIQCGVEFLSRVRIYASPLTQAELGKRLVKLDDDPVQWINLEKTVVLPGNGTLTSFPLEHSTECFGFRLDWAGHSFAYVTDTIARPQAPYVDQIQGVNLLLHDAYMPNRLAKTAEWTTHSYTDGAVQVAAQANVRRLILVHNNPFLPRIDESELELARRRVPIVEIGEDKMELEF
jgi:ribonuclease BN (tRNA processing enzyme)